MNIQDKLINDKLELLFAEHKENSNSIVKEIASRHWVRSIVEDKAILFVGMNPSYVESTKANSGTYLLQDAIKGYSQHYGKFQKLLEDTIYENDWTYLDVLQMRETTQGRINEIMKEDRGLDFIVSQLQITIEQLEQLSPKLIVVCNSGAADFFGVNRDGDSGIWMGYTFEWNENFGVYTIHSIAEDSVKKGVKSTNLSGVPIIFTSNLNYMDRNTRKTLQWQIRQILTYHDLFFNQDQTTFYDRFMGTIKSKLKLAQQCDNEKSEASSTKQYEAMAVSRDQQKRVYQELESLLLKL